MRFNEINDARTDEALGDIIRGGVVAGKKFVKTAGNKVGNMAKNAATKVGITNQIKAGGPQTAKRMATMGATPASGAREVGPGDVQQGAPGAQQAGPGMPDPNDTSPEAMKVKQQQKKQLQAQLKKITTDYKQQSAQLKTQIASIK